MTISLPYGDERIRAAVWKNIHPEPNSGCWLWSAYINPDGYGRGYPVKNGRLVMAHRITWEAMMGRAVQEGHELDHLCRVRACCNPAHLEEVSHKTNVLRGESLPSLNAAKTHCKRGHLLHPEDCYAPKGSGRLCKKCHKIQQCAYLVRHNKPIPPRYKDLATSPEVLALVD